MKKYIFSILLSLQLFSDVKEVSQVGQLEHEVKQSGTEVFVDCYATYCRPCRMVAGLFEEWAETFQAKGKFLKVDLEKSSDIAEKYKIRSIPTLLVFDESGKLNSKKVGLDEIVTYFNSMKTLPSKQ